MELFKNANYDFLGKKWFFIALSMALTLIGAISLIVKGGPRYGIDFRGGTVVYVKFQQTPQLDQLRNALRARGMGDSSIQSYGPASANEVLISVDQRGGQDQAIDTSRAVIVETLRSTFSGDQGQKIDLNNVGRDDLMTKLATAGLSNDDAAKLADAILARRAQRSGLLNNTADLRDLPGFNPQVEQVLNREGYFGPFAVRNAESVGPKVGSELRKQALYATLYALAGMLVYIAFRFEWIYGVAAVIAVFHDVIITLGFFSLFNYEISLTVVAALLTLVGFSVNDTIVIFDRIRENLKLMRREGLPVIANRSINQTLSRTIITTGTAFMTVLSLFLFGGEVLHPFAFALVVGFIIGTYSSLFIAAPIVVVWDQWMETRYGRGRVITLEKERVREKQPKVGARVKA